MNFNVEKFMAFELGSGMSLQSCIKCCVAYAMGRETPQVCGYLRPYTNF
jgi:hypothetical protein